MESSSNGVPFDIIEEILLRLPVRTLLQFKCVCKQWCTLIGSPTFVNQHFSHKSNPECLRIWYYVHLEDRLTSALYSDECGSVYEEPVHLQIPHETSYLLGPLSGVFCVVSKGHLALFNPTMRQFRPILSHGLKYDHSNLSIYEHVNGFGLDPLSGDYTVVSTRSLFVLETDVMVSHHVCIYNSRRGSWRCIEDVDLATKIGNATSQHSICLDGVQYWLTSTSNADDAVIVLALENNENFQEIQVPDCVNYEGQMFLALYGDSIGLLTFDLHSTDHRIIVWVMKEVGCWTKTFTLGPIEGLKSPICLWKSTELVFETKDDTSLTLYNVSTGVLRTIEICGEKGSKFFAKAVPYKASLVSIKGDGDSCVLWDTSSPFIKDWFSQKWIYDSYSLGRIGIN